MYTYVCLYVRTICTLCVYVCMYVCVYVCMHVCVCMYVYMYVHVCMYVSIYILLCRCTYARTYVRTYVRTCMSASHCQLGQCYLTLSYQPANLSAGETCYIRWLYTYLDPQLQQSNVTYADTVYSRVICSSSLRCVSISSLIQEAIYCY